MIAAALVTLLMFCAVWILVTLTSDNPLPEYDPEWEVVPAFDAGELVGYQVRWSIPDDRGRYLWVGHYYSGPDNSLRWCQHAAESHCKRLNTEKKMPCEFDACSRS